MSDTVVTSPPIARRRPVPIIVKLALGWVVLMILVGVFAEVLRRTASQPST